MDKCDHSSGYFRSNFLRASYELILIDRNTNETAMKSIDELKRASMDEEMAAEQKAVLEAWEEEAEHDSS